MALTVFIFIILLVPLYVHLQVKTVFLTQDDQTITVKTKSSCVADLLKEQGILLQEHDYLQPGLNDVLANNMTITIQKAKPVSLIIGGNSVQIETSAKLVKDVLIEAGVNLGHEDKVIPGLEEHVKDQIQVTKVEKKLVTEEKKIDYSVEKRTDNNLYQGEQRIIQKGKNGLEQNTYRVTFEDGQEVSRELIEKKIIKEPVKQIVSMGSLQVASRSGNNLEFEQVIEMTATAYTHTGNMTATDIWPAPGIVAVDPKVIPLKTRLYIEGYGYATAMDTGGAIKGNRIDLFFNTKAEALKWGRKSVKVFILKS